MADKPVSKHFANWVKKRKAVAVNPHAKAYKGAAMIAKAASMRKEEAVVEAKKPKISDHVSADSHGKDGDGNHVFRRTFFYRHGGDSKKFADGVSSQLHKAGLKHTVVDHGEHNAPFRGGASVRKSSHWWAKVKLHEAAPTDGCVSGDAYKACENCSATNITAAKCTVCGHDNSKPAKPNSAEVKSDQGFVDGAYQTYIGKTRKEDYETATREDMELVSELSDKKLLHYIHKSTFSSARDSELGMPKTRKAANGAKARTRALSKLRKRNPTAKGISSQGSSTKMTYDSYKSKLGKIIEKWVTEMTADERSDQKIMSAQRQVHRYKEMNADGAAAVRNAQQKKATPAPKDQSRIAPTPKDQDRIAPQAKDQSRIPATTSAPAAAPSATPATPTAGSPPLPRAKPSSGSPPIPRAKPSDYARAKPDMPPAQKKALSATSVGRPDATTRAAAQQKARQAPPPKVSRAAPQVKSGGTNFSGGQGQKGATRWAGAQDRRDGK